MAVSPPSALVTSVAPPRCGCSSSNLGARIRIAQHGRIVQRTRDGARMQRRPYRVGPRCQVSIWREGECVPVPAHAGISVGVRHGTVIGNSVTARCKRRLCMEGRMRREMRYRRPAAEVRCAADVHATHTRCTAGMGYTAKAHSTTAKMRAAAHPMRDSAAAEMWRAATDVWRSTTSTMKSAAAAATTASSWRGVGGTREGGDSGNNDEDLDGRHGHPPAPPTGVPWVWFYRVSK
jgi:hypothetical protein